MKKKFKRNLVFPIFLLLPAMLFGIITLMQIGMGNPIAILMLIISTLFYVNSIWLIFTPFAHINEKRVLFHKALITKQKEIFFSSVERIEFPKEKLLKIHGKDKGIINIKLDMLKKSDRENLKELLLNLISKH